MEPSLESLYQFPDFRQHDLDHLVQLHHTLHIHKGGYVFSAGQTARQYFIVQRGLVRSFVSDPDGNEITTGFFAPGEIVIEAASLFRQQPSQETFQALTDCVLWELKFDDFQNVFRRVNAFAEWGRMWMTHALSLQKQRMLDMITKSAQDRYGELLEKHPEILRDAPLKHIASYLGVTDSSLSRIRKEFIQSQI